MSRPRGARSIRGAMGAYVGAGVLALALLAIALWWGGPDEPRCFVELTGGSRWEAATLDDGRRQVTLGRGERVEIPPGRYRLTLLGDGGSSAVREVEIVAPLTDLEGFSEPVR